MKRRRIWQLVLLVLAAILVTTQVQAMVSPNYGLNWFVLLDGSGFDSNSASYRAELTVGQSVIGPMSGADKKVGLGYWAGVAPIWHIFLPVAVKD